MTKNIVSMGAAVLLILLLFSCSSAGTSSVQPQEEDFYQLMAAAEGIQASVQRPVPTGTNRTVQPADVGEQTPAEIYGTATETVRYPASDSEYIEDVYGNDSAYGYFTLDKAANNYYLVKFYLYDSSDFEIDYEYEEYYVQGDDDFWTFYSDTEGTSGIAVLETHYFDGSVEERTVESTYYGPGYAAFEVPAVAENVSQYSWSGTLADITEPTADAADTQFSIYVTSSIPGFFADLNRAEFYTETPSTELADGTLRSSIRYSLKDLWGIYDKEVERYQQTVNSFGDIVSETVRSLSTLSYEDDVYLSVIRDETIQTNSDGLVTLTRDTRTFWKDDVSGTPGKHTVLSITQEAQGSHLYSGTLEMIWSNWTDVWTVEMEGDEYTMTWSNGYSNDRSVFSSDTSMNISISNIDDGIDVQLASGGSFSASLQQGA
ncbi:MAG: hypothetical protein ACLFR1_14945, partial [Spirochaetia bacterium]